MKKTYRIDTFYHDYTDCIEIFTTTETDPLRVAQEFGPQAALWDEDEAPTLTPLTTEDSRTDAARKGISLTISELPNTQGTGIVQPTFVAAFLRSDLI